MPALHGVGFASCFYVVWASLLRGKPIPCGAGICPFYHVGIWRRLQLPSATRRWGLLQTWGREGVGWGAAEDHFVFAHFSRRETFPRRCFNLSSLDETDASEHLPDFLEKTFRNQTIVSVRN